MSDSKIGEDDFKHIRESMTIANALSGTYNVAGACWDSYVRPSIYKRIKSRILRFLEWWKCRGNVVRIEDLEPGEYRAIWIKNTHPSLFTLTPEIQFWSNSDLKFRWDIPDE